MSKGKTLRIDRGYIKSGIRTRSSERVNQSPVLRWASCTENELLAARGESSSHEISSQKIESVSSENAPNDQLRP